MGVVVLAPVMGTAVGTQQGGVVGGVAGLVGGESGNLTKAKKRTRENMLICFVIELIFVLIFDVSRCRGWNDRRRGRGRGR